MAADQLRLGPIPVTGLTLRAHVDLHVNRWGLWLNRCSEGAGYALDGGHRYHDLTWCETIDVVDAYLDALGDRRWPGYQLPRTG